MVLPRIDCNKSIVISLSNIIIYANTSSMGSFDDRENQPKGEFHREKKHDPNESMYSRYFAFKRETICFFITASSSDARITLLFFNFILRISLHSAPYTRLCVEREEMFISQFPLHWANRKSISFHFVRLLVSVRISKHICWFFLSFVFFICHASHTIR